MRLILLWLSLLSLNRLFAQSPFENKIRWGTPNANTAYVIEPLGLVGERFYTSGWFGLKKYTISEYSINTLSLIQNEKLNLEVEKDKLDFVSSFISNEKLFFITRNKDKAADIATYYVQEYLEAGQLGKPKKIAEINIDGLSFLPATQKDIIRTAEFKLAFKIAQSENGEHLVFMYPSNIDDKNGRSWNVKCFDKNFEETESYQFNIQRSDFYLSTVKVDNTGTIFGLGISGLDIEVKQEMYENLGSTVGEFSNDNLINFKGDSTFLIKIDATNQTNEIFPVVPHQKKEVVGVSLEIMDDQPIIYGLFGMPDLESATGSFIIKLKRTGEVEFNNTMVFGEELINKGTKYQDYKGVDGLIKRRIKRYLLGNLIKDENGNYMFTGEHFNAYHGAKSNQLTSNTMDATAYTGYYFGDILIVYTSKEGDANWADIIPKSQHSFNDLGRNSSFFTVSTNGKIYFIFNDSEFKTSGENFDDASLKEKKKAKGNRVIAAVEYSTTGFQQKFILEDSQILIPRSCKQINSDEFLFFAGVGYNQIAGKAKLKR